MQLDEILRIKKLSDEDLLLSTKKVAETERRITFGVNPYSWTIKGSDYEHRMIVC